MYPNFFSKLEWSISLKLEVVTERVTYFLRKKLNLNFSNPPFEGVKYEQNVIFLYQLMRK